MLGLTPKDALWWANEIRIWAAALAGFAALVAFASQYAQIRLSEVVSREKDDAFRKYRLDSEERVAALQVVAAEARHQAEAQGLETAAAKLETERLKAHFAWRELTELQKSDLTRELSQHPSSISIAWFAQDPETFAFADSFVQLFQRAGWTVYFDARSYYTSLLYGIYIPGLKTPELSAMRNAFRTAHIAFSTNDVPIPQLALRPPMPAGIAVLFVGLKSKGLFQ